jgi:hypothetical protein
MHLRVIHRIMIADGIVYPRLVGCDITLLSSYGDIAAPLAQRAINEYAAQYAVQGMTDPDLHVTL